MEIEDDKHSYFTYCIRVPRRDELAQHLLEKDIYTIGGYLSLWITGTTFGISAGIGFIILFGVATIDGIVLIGNIRQNLNDRMPLKEAISKGVYSRIRPILMIAFMGAMGLLPAALSNGMGSEIQKPLAIMIVGGLLICMILSLTVLPQVYYLAYRKSAKKDEA